MIPLRDVIPSRTTPYVTVGLIVVNVLVFLYELTLPERSLDEFVLYFGLVPAAFSWVAVRDVDVPARRDSSRRRQHAVPVDLRRQRRGPHGPRAVPGVLPALRRGGGAGTDGDAAGFDCRDGRRQRRDRRRDGRVLRALPALAHRHPGADLLLFPAHRGAGDLLPRHVVPAAVRQRRRLDRGGDRRRAGRRRRVLGARRRLRRLA